MEEFSDINPEFTMDFIKTDLVKDIDETAIKNSIRNILMTRKTERRMMPRFGASLEQLLFEPVDAFTAKKIGSIIFEELEFWESRITLTNVNVIADPDNALYEISIEFSIKATNIINTSNISFVLQQ